MGREGQGAREDNQGTIRAFMLQWNALITAFCNYVIFYTIQYSDIQHNRRQNRTAGRNTLFSDTDTNFYP